MKTLELMTRTSKEAILGIGIASMLFFTACEQDDATSIPADEVDAATIEVEAVAQSDFEEIDDMTLSGEGRRLPRPILLSAITFPILQAHLRILHEGRTKPMHLGEIHNEVCFMVRDVFAPVHHSFFRPSVD